MFAKYRGQPDVGLEVGQVYWINIREEYKNRRIISVVVGDYYAADYDNFAELVLDWSLGQWVK